MSNLADMKEKLSTIKHRRECWYPYNIDKKAAGKFYQEIHKDIDFLIAVADATLLSKPDEKCSECGQTKP